MAYTATDVKNLRETTGAGMMDCKKALDETGDLQKAVDYLRAKGLAAAAKKQSRVAAEGMISSNVKDKIGALVEVNCETDFVARNEEFVKYADAIANALLQSNPSDEAVLMATEVDGKTLLDLHNEILAKFSEKIGIKRFEVLDASGYIADYIHAGNRLGVLLQTNLTNTNDEVKAMLREIAMQIAAMNPSYVKREDVQTDALMKEIEIYREKAIQEGKKPEIAEAKR